MCLMAYVFRVRMRAVAARAQLEVVYDDLPMSQLPKVVPAPPAFVEDGAALADEEATLSL